MALLFTNVYVLHLAKTYNDRVCHDSIALAAGAALEGKPTEAVQRAARAGMDNCGYGGAFISHPQYTAFKDDITTDVRVLELQTQTIVAVPIYFLAYGLKSDSNRVVYTSTYTYQIKNPREALSAPDSQDVEDSANKSEAPASKSDEPAQEAESEGKPQTKLEVKPASKPE
jgi:hypothetical protein